MYWHARSAFMPRRLTGISSRTDSCSMNIDNGIANDIANARGSRRSEETAMEFAGKVTVEAYIISDYKKYVGGSRRRKARRVDKKDHLLASSAIGS